jgi:AraC-like DNA-binding protein
MKAMIFTVMPMFVCLFWSTMLVIDLASNRSKSRLHLFWFMLTTTLLYFGHCAFFNHSTAYMPLTDTLYCTANLAVYPLYYLYICSLTIRSQHYKDRWVMLVPAVIGGVAVGFAYSQMTAEETQLFIDRYLYEGTREGLYGMAVIQSYVHDACKVVFAILILPVFIHGRSHIQEYNELIYSIYADTEKKTLTSLHYMLIALGITSIASFVANLIGRQQFDDSIWLLAIPSTLFSMLLFSIGYIGYKLQFSIEDIEKDEQQADDAANELSAIAEIRARIEQLMVEEQLFRQPNLKIIDLVQRLATNRNYIYQAINRDMGIPFCEYVNRMRIDYAITLINQNPGMPLNEVANQSGFTSSTTFYRNFKQYYGVGPKEYLNNLKK